MADTGFLLPVGLFGGGGSRQIILLDKFYEKTVRK